MYAGIDVGASATKALIINNEDKIVSYRIVPSGIDFKAASEKALKEALQTSNLRLQDISYKVSTGYGRALVDADSTSSEIICISRGIHRIFPSTRTIVDVGGQDSKAIKIDENGRVSNFVMNDKCAAGTGRFLEVMATILRKPIEELGRLHFKSGNPVEISSTCTVFTESEVISHMSKGVGIEDVIAGIHKAIAERIYNMSIRIGFEKSIAFTGGVAKNQGFTDALSKKIGLTPKIPEEPQTVCAFGAALSAVKKYKETTDHC